MNKPLPKTVTVSLKRNEARIIQDILGALAVRAKIPSDREWFMDIREIFLEVTRDRDLGEPNVDYLGKSLLENFDFQS